MLPEIFKTEFIKKVIIVGLISLFSLNVLASGDVGNENAYNYHSVNGKTSINSTVKTDPLSPSKKVNRNLLGPDTAALLTQQALKLQGSVQKTSSFVIYVPAPGNDTSSKSPSDSVSSAKSMDGSPVFNIPFAFDNTNSPSGSASSAHSVEGSPVFNIPLALDNTNSPSDSVVSANSLPDTSDSHTVVLLWRQQALLRSASSSSVSIHVPAPGNDTRSNSNSPSGSASSAHSLEEPVGDDFAPTSTIQKWVVQLDDQRSSTPPKPQSHKQAATTLLSSIQGPILTVGHVEGDDARNNNSANLSLGGNENNSDKVSVHESYLITPSPSSSQAGKVELLASVANNGLLETPITPYKGKVIPAQAGIQGGVRVGDGLGSGSPAGMTPGAGMTTPGSPSIKTPARKSPAPGSFVGSPHSFHSVNVGIPVLSPIRSSNNNNNYSAFETVPLDNGVNSLPEASVVGGDLSQQRISPDTPSSSNSNSSFVGNNNGNGSLVEASLHAVAAAMPNNSQNNASNLSFAVSGGGVVVGGANGSSSSAILTSNTASSADLSSGSAVGLGGSTSQVPDRNIVGDSSNISSSSQQQQQNPVGGANTSSSSSVSSSSNASTGASLASSGGDKKKGRNLSAEFNLAASQHNSSLSSSNNNVQPTADTAAKSSPSSFGNNLDTSIADSKLVISAAQSTIHDGTVLAEKPVAPKFSSSASLPSGETMSPVLNVVGAGHDSDRSTWVLSTWLSQSSAVVGADNSATTTFEASSSNAVGKKITTDKLTYVHPAVLNLINTNSFNNHVILAKAGIQVGDQTVVADAKVYSGSSAGMTSDASARMTTVGDGNEVNASNNPKGVTSLADENTGPNNAGDNSSSNLFAANLGSSDAGTPGASNLPTTPSVEGGTPNDNRGGSSIGAGGVNNNIGNTTPTKPTTQASNLSVGVSPSNTFGSTAATHQQLNNNNTTPPSTPTTATAAAGDNGTTQAVTPTAVEVGSSSGSSGASGGEKATSAAANSTSNTSIPKPHPAVGIIPGHEEFDEGDLALLFTENNIVTTTTTNANLSGQNDRKVPPPPPPSQKNALEEMPFSAVDLPEGFNNSIAQPVEQNQVDPKGGTPPDEEGWILDPVFGKRIDHSADQKTAKPSSIAGGRKLEEADPKPQPPIYSRPPMSASMPNTSAIVISMPGDSRSRAAAIVSNSSHYHPYSYHSSSNCGGTTGIPCPGEEEGGYEINSNEWPYGDHRLEAVGGGGGGPGDGPEPKCGGDTGILCPPTGQYDATTGEYYSYVSVEEVKKSIASSVLAAPVSIISDYMDTISSNVTLRLDSFIRNDMLPALGIASGENDINKGFWAKIFRSDSKQKADSRSIGFSNKQTGLLIGLDGEFLEDELVLGTTFSFATSSATFKKISSSIVSPDKQKSKLYVGGLYGEYALTSNLFLNGDFRYARGLITTKRNSNKSVIKGEMMADIFRETISLSYQHKYKNFAFVPKAGLLYDQFIVGALEEEGTGIKTRVSARKGSKLSVVAGLGVRSFNQISENFSLVPELHVNIENTLRAKHNIASIKTIEKVPQTIMATPSKLPRTTYLVGGSLSIKNNKFLTMEIGYDYNFRRKYGNHVAYGSFIVKF